MADSPFLLWMAIIGALLLTMALLSAWIQRLPVSTAAIYLGIGCLIGPWGFDLLRVDLTNAEPWLERFTELAVILSLFVGGLRLRLPVRHRAWNAVWRLASGVMLLSIAGVAWAAWALLGLPAPVALLLGAVLAPTDPVLAGAVTVGHSEDRDRFRFALSGEAGLNDGAAFPFVALALLWMEPGLSLTTVANWAAHDLLWAITAGLAIGFVFGRLVGRAAIALRSRHRDTAAPTDFLVLALIALAYVVAQVIGAWGFLAVFAAGIGLRSAELSTVKETPHPEHKQSPEGAHPPAETMVAPNVVTEGELAEPAVAAGVLVAEVFSFGDTMERILEVLLVVLVGVSLATHWDPRALWIAAALFLVIRPLATFGCLTGTSTTLVQRGLVGWFGIRGIGSLYYLAFAFASGIQGATAQELADVTLSVVAISIVAHGLTAQPLMNWYERRSSRARRSPYPRDESAYSE